MIPFSLFMTSDRDGACMIPLVEEIYKSGIVLVAQDKQHQLKANVDRTEGEFLFELISSDASIAKTLEVGFAYGLSSLHITAATAGRAGAHHVIIDPFQKTQWHGIGIANLRRAGVTNYELIEELSEFALPRLAKANPGGFDFVFIDGWHTFDHTLIDLFYANRLLRVGGYLVVDDCGVVGVAKAVSYVANYPCYSLHAQSKGTSDTTKRRLAKKVFNSLPSSLRSTALPKKIYDALHRARYSSMVALKKTAEDDRNWIWYRDF